MENILKRLKNNDTQSKTRATFYFNMELLEKFKKLCKENNVAQSRVLEELMRDFCEQL